MVLDWDAPVQKSSDVDPDVLRPFSLPFLEG